MNKDSNCLKKLSCLHICACICVYTSVHVCMYTDPEVLQHECGDQRKMNLCLRFLFSSVSCKTRILSPVSNFHFIIGVLRLQIWFYVCSGNAFECVSSCIQNKPSSYWLISSAKASVICIWHTLLGLSQLTVWLLHAWPLVPCRVLILYHLLSILSYSRMMQSLENMLRSPPLSVFSIRDLQHQ